MKPQMIVVTLGAISGIFAGRELDASALGTFGLVVVGMFAGLFILKSFTKRSDV